MLLYNSKSAGYGCKVFFRACKPYARQVKDTLIESKQLEKQVDAERADKSGLGFEYKDLKGSAQEAVRFADALIAELKKGGTQ